MAARHLNFGSAAQELNVTQPSVSQTIKVLEQRCGVALFVRGNRGVTLTPEGRVLQDAVQGGFRQIEDSLRAISALGVNYLTFAASTSAAAHWLMPKFYQLQTDHPNLKIKLVTTDRDLEPDSDIDVTIWIRDRDFDRPNSWYLCDEVVFPVCTPAYLQRHAPLRRVADLAGHRLLHAHDRFRRRTGWGDWMAGLGYAAPQDQPDMVVHDHLLAVHAALAGEGVALGWNLTFALLLRNGLLVRPLADELRTGKAFFLVGRQGARVSRPLEQMVHWLIEGTAHLRDGARAASEG